MGGYPSGNITIANNVQSSELMGIMESEATGVRNRISSPPSSTVDAFLQKYSDLLNLDAFIVRQSQNQIDAFVITDTNNRQIVSVRNVPLVPDCCQSSTSSGYSLINIHGGELFQFTWDWAGTEGQTVAGRVRLNSKYSPTRMTCLSLQTRREITLLFRGRGYEAIELGMEPIRATETGIHGYLRSDLSLIFRVFIIFSSANFYNRWYNKRWINSEYHVPRRVLSGTGSIGSGGWNAGNGGVTLGSGSFGGGSFGGGSFGGGSFGGGSFGGGSCGGGSM